MLLFWIVAGLISAICAGLMLLRAAAAAGQAPADPSLPVYRRQLAEIDELAERGLIAGEERRRAHAEAARRLLAAVDRTEAPWSAGGRGGVLAVAVVTPLAALALYL